MTQCFSKLMPIL